MIINSKAANADGGIAKAASQINYLRSKYNKQTLVDQDLINLSIEFCSVLKLYRQDLLSLSESNHTSVLLNSLNHLLMVAEGRCR